MKTTKKPRLVVIGNGMAGMRTIEELLKMSPNEFEITVFGAEPQPNYNRILLSPVLSGEMSFQDTVLNDWDWYKENNITLHAGKKVTKIDRKNCIVESEDGLAIPYDRLLIATGSNPIMLPIPGIELPGVLGYRSIDDVEKMLEAAKSFKRAVVIGGGLLGLEAANGLSLQGMEVSVVHLCDWPMERQLDKVGGDLLKVELEKRGLKFYLSRQTEAILSGSNGGDVKVTGLRFKDGEEIPADLVVMAAGIRPNIALAQSAKIHCERGIVVNDTMQTYDPKIYSVGECVQHRGQTYGLVAPLFEQAKVAANHLAEYGRMRYEGSAVSTKLKVTGIDLFSAGDFNPGPDDEELLLQDSARGVYKKLVLRGNKLRGAVMYGDTLDGPWYFQMMRDGTDVSEMREHILFGQMHIGDSGRGGASNVANMPDNAEICGCNGVTKGTIVKTILDKKLFTLEEVRAHTKASSSCGSCTGLCEAILANTLGDYSAKPSKKAMCACTEHAHQDVQEAIGKLKLKTIPDLMKALQWKTPDGCHVCRPALNYYLIAAWPNEYQDDSRSRFINERVHANIQKDGTYSVIPRIWGGVTSPSELRSIAEIAERHEVRTVHITGGQRIGLYGITKENLPKMWGELVEAGFVSGHAYGKALRTVKTCVGAEWCRFGTQDSTDMGIQIEKMTWGSWTPHKFKIAVSGCPRNCAEATIKDFGVVCVDSGYEIHVGGNGGIKVRVTDFLCKVATAAEVLEYCGAFMQLYREGAHYMERTAPWIERVGLAHVKQHVVEDAAGRAALFARFLDSQRNSQDDPWKERAEGKDAHEYQSLATIA